MRTDAFPRDDSHNGWYACLPPAPPPRSLGEDLRADCVIVGAGFTGLAAARHLAELRPEWRVVVLEGQRPGWGTAGRSSGFVVDLALFIARMGGDEADRFVHLSRLGIARLRAAVEAHGIDCAWDEAGWLHVASEDAGMRSLEDLQSWLEGRGERFEHLDAEGLREVTGSSYYRAGVRLPGSVLVQAAALARGLAETLPPSVELYEHSPVSGIHRNGAHRKSLWSLEVKDRRVAADRVLLATNAALPALGVLRRRLFPLFTYGSLTRALTQAEQEALGGEREWGVLAQEPLGSTVRRTRDQRLLIRNTVHYAPRLSAPDSVRTRAAEAHRKALERRFPDLASVPFEHTWAGAMGMSSNHRHYFGELREGLYAAGGFYGAGIAMGTACGHLMAEWLAGESSADLDTMRSLRGPAWIPPQPFLGLGVRWRVGRMQRQAGDRI